MSKMERAVVSRGGARLRQPVTRNAAIKQPVATRNVNPKAVVKPRADDAHDAQVELLRMSFAWYVVLAGTLVVPVFVILSARFYDAVPWSPNLGAFIMAGGAVLIATVFPFARQYRALSIAVMKEYMQSRQLNAQHVKSLTRLMFLGTACAELPALAGLVYFFMTRATLGSLLLCTPAVLMILVLFRPGDLRSL